MLDIEESVDLSIISSELNANSFLKSGNKYMLVLYKSSQRFCLNQCGEIYIVEEKMRIKKEEFYGGVCPKCNCVVYWKEE